MTNVPVDDKTLAALVAKGRSVVAVTDAGGRVVGYFAPAVSQEEMARRHLGLPDPEAVRQQRDAAERLYTTSQVKEHLKSLESRG